MAEQSGYPHVAPTTLLGMGKRRRVQDSDPPVDLNTDSQIKVVGRMVKTSKVLLTVSLTNISSPKSIHDARMLKPFNIQNSRFFEDCLAFSELNCRESVFSNHYIQELYSWSVLSALQVKGPIYQPPFKRFRKV